MNFSINSWTMGELSKGPSRRVRPEPGNTIQKETVKAKFNEKKVWQSLKVSLNS